VRYVRLAHDIEHARNEKKWAVSHENKVIKDFCSLTPFRCACTCGVFFFHGVTKFSEHVSLSISPFITCHSKSEIFNMQFSKSNLHRLDYADSSGRNTPTKRREYTNFGVFSALCWCISPPVNVR
jgi:hypothetical protein